MEGDVIITQDLFVYEIIGEDANGNLIGRHRSTGIGRPKFWDRARYYGEEKRLAAALDAAERRRTRGRRGEDVAVMKMQTHRAVLLVASRSAASPGCSSIRCCPASAPPSGAAQSVARSEPAAARVEPRRRRRSRREQVEESLKDLDDQEQQAEEAAAADAASSRPASTWSKQQFLMISPAASACSRFLLLF